MAIAGFGRPLKLKYVSGVLKAKAVFVVAVFYQPVFI
jgi:hypothetical protein